MLPTLVGAGFGQEVKEEALETTEEGGGGEASVLTRPDARTMT